MKKLLVPLLLLAACSQQGDQGSGNAASPAQQAARDTTQPPGIGSLVGLYESGGGTPKNQMCVVERKGGEARFGIVIWGGNMHSCSGAGSLNREGATLRLAMAGDSACTIEASISGKTVRLPQAIPPGCSYYCGARASMAGAELTQTGTTKTAAMKAKDLVGDPLCATEGG